MGWHLDTYDEQLTGTSFLGTELETEKITQRR